MADGRMALVLGATGGIGGETAAALSRRGWRVRAMARAGAPEAGSAAGRLDAEWVRGDAGVADDVVRAAAGAAAIVHAVNPPGYRDWGRLVLPMIDNSIAAARATGARLVLPGTIYNYGADAFSLLREGSPQHPATEKGRIRVELERRLEAASDAAPVLIVRFGDFFGPRPGNNWFSQGIVTPGRRLRAIARPGDTGVGHAWAYLPDAAEAFARLLDRAEALPRFARFHFAGTWDADGRAMPRAIRTALARDVPERGIPWRLLRLAGLFSEKPRELVKMRHIWRTPIRLDNAALVAFLGEEPHTPLDEAVAATLRGLSVT